MNEPHNQTFNPSSLIPHPSSFYVIEAADGRRIYITDDKAEYKKLQRENKIVFNSEELALVKPEAAGIAMDAKEIWKRAEVVEPMEVGFPAPHPHLNPPLEREEIKEPPRLQGEGWGEGGREMTQGGLF